MTVLELSGIPFLASERGEDMPLIAAGGPCVCNPEPVAEIMDVMFFGDGEELVNDFMDVYAECRRRGLNKRDTLIELSKSKAFTFLHSIKRNMMKTAISAEL